MFQHFHLPSSGYCFPYPSLCCHFPFVCFHYCYAHLLMGVGVVVVGDVPLLLYCDLVFPVDCHCWLPYTSTALFYIILHKHFQYLLNIIFQLKSWRTKYISLISQFNFLYLVKSYKLQVHYVKLFLNCA